MMNLNIESSTVPMLTKAFTRSKNASSYLLLLLSFTCILKLTVNNLSLSLSHTNIITHFLKLGSITIRSNSKNIYFLKMSKILENVSC